MGAFAAKIEEMQNAQPEQRVRLMDGMLETVRRLEGRLFPEERRELEDFVLGQLRLANWEAPQERDVKRRDWMLECGVAAVDLLKAMLPGGLPERRTLEEAARFTELLAAERAIETALAPVMGDPDAGEAAAQAAVDLAQAETDEFRRSLFWQPFAGDREVPPVLSPAAKRVFCAYANGELRRFASAEAPPKEFADAAELAADYCRQFADAETPDCLRAVLEKDCANVSYYAAETLFTLGEEVPQQALDRLARDDEYAHLTFRMLERFRALDRFPAECRDAVHLASSEFCHWLTHPAELGEKPDAMEFLGKTKKRFRKNEYYVFRFCSRSPNLLPEERGRWLIGWCSEGDTWSEYDFYEDFEGQTPEETLRNIRRHVL